MAWSEPRTQSSGALSPALFSEVERLRRNAATLVERTEVYRLEAIAIRLRNLEMLSEQILSAVPRAPAERITEPPDIPDFLRRC